MIDTLELLERLRDAERRNDHDGAIAVCKELVDAGAHVGVHTGEAGFGRHQGRRRRDGGGGPPGGAPASGAGALALGSWRRPRSAASS